MSPGEARAAAAQTVNGAAPLQVHFDGMGPTWTKLAEKAWEAFPEGTHGIIADADYAPARRMLGGNFDKMDLDIGANKILYNLWSDAAAVSDVRRMDWIFRNMPGVRIERRVHQTLRVPPFAGAGGGITVGESKTMHIHELGGGYQLRTMSGRGRNYRYIKLLMQDLEELPDDPRTLYYIADSHRGVFMAGYDTSAWVDAPYDACLTARTMRFVSFTGNITASDWDHLREAVKWYKRRLEVPAPNSFEETYFTYISIAELSERFLGDFAQGFEYYQKAFEFDPQRADPMFYIGQRKRLLGNPQEAVQPLLTASRMRAPKRSVFVWVGLYDCLAAVELGKAVQAVLAADGYSSTLTPEVSTAPTHASPQHTVHPVPCTLHADCG